MKHCVIQAPFNGGWVGVWKGGHKDGGGKDELRGVVSTEGVGERLRGRMTDATVQAHSTGSHSFQ